VALGQGLMLELVRARDSGDMEASQRVRQFHPVGDTLPSMEGLAAGQLGRDLGRGRAPLASVVLLDLDRAGIQEGMVMFQWEELHEWRHRDQG